MRCDMQTLTPLITCGDFVLATFSGPKQSIVDHGVAWQEQFLMIRKLGPTPTG